MEFLNEFLSSFNYGQLVLWLLRLGLFFTIFGLITMPKKKTNLKKIITTQQDGRM